MAKNIMIQGTMSNAGKSLLCAGLCRLFHQDGYRVAPFKSQNMALNSFITRKGGEMGRAQVVQAEACGKEADVRMNPILLKPTTDKGSQVIVNGHARASLSAMEYMKRKKEYIPAILEAYDSLAAENDIIVIEGAGSPAEINLKQADIVNMGLAKMVDAPVVLVGDIDRGGVFAQLYGTLALLSEEERRRVKATVVNKFRGDVEILRPGLDTLVDLCRVPVLGVLPYLNVEIEDEDSLSDRLQSRTLRKPIDIAVIRLPRLSNFSDFTPLEHFENVSVRYIRRTDEFYRPDLLILPGTKSTIEDLLWLRQSGLEAKLRQYVARGGILLGICGGYQMLGKEILDPDHVESPREDRVEALGYLDFSTEFCGEKVQKQSQGRLNSVGGPLEALSGQEYSGYEIHMGRSRETLPVLSQAGNIYGTYLHGFFDTPDLLEKLLRSLCERKGISFDNRHFDLAAFKEEQYDKLAQGVRENLDMDLLYRIVEGRA